MCTGRLYSSLCLKKAWYRKWITWFYRAARRFGVSVVNAHYIQQHAAVTAQALTTTLPIAHHNVNASSRSSVADRSTKLPSPHYPRQTHFTKLPFLCWATWHFYEHIRLPLPQGRHEAAHYHKLNNTARKQHNLIKDDKQQQRHVRAYCTDHNGPQEL